MSEAARQYLLEYLQDEFRNFPDLVIRIPPITREENDGVLVRSERRQYFFPTAWVEQKRMSEVEREVRRIKDLLEPR